MDQAGPTQPRRILIVSADMGEGHNATGRALREIAEDIWPGCTIRWLDVLDAMGPRTGALFRSIYAGSVERSPWLYEYFYQAVWRYHWFSESSKRFIGEWAGRALAPHLDDFRPDLVLSTYPMGSTGLAWLRRHRGLTVPVGAWVSDFNPHPSWMHPEIDLNLVMHDVAVPVATAAVPGATVAVSAPPVTRRFHPADAPPARHALGLPESGLVAMVSCGSLGFGDAGETVRELLDGSPDLHAVVIAGRNAALEDALRRRFAAEPRVHVHGWVADMPAVFHASDLVVTNAGGATSLEALACGRPVIMHRPIAGHGRANADLMARAGLAIVRTEPGDLAKLVADLAGDPDRLDQLRRTALDYARARRVEDGLRALAARPTPRRRYRLRAADAIFAYVHTPEVPQEVGAILLFDPRADGTGPSRAAATELIARVPGVHGRLTVGGGLRRPSWYPDDSIDRAGLVTEVRVGEPGAPADLGAAVDAFYGVPLPSSHPCGAGQLVTGLPGGQSALLVKLHHALGDGMTVLRTLLSGLESANRIWATAPVTPLARTPIRRADLPRLARGLWTLARTGSAAPLDIGPGLDRHQELLRYPRQPIRAAARRLDRTVTELLMGAFAEALHRGYGCRAGAPTSLRLMVPWSLRGTGSAHAAGNRTGAVSLDLPIGPMAMRRRLDLVGDRLRARVDGGVPQAAEAVVRLFGVLPAPLHARAARWAYRSTWFHGIASVLPGPRREVRLDGCQLVTTFPVLPVAPGAGLSWGAMTWGADTAICLTGQGNWAHRLPRLAADFRAVLDELTAPDRVS